MAETGRSGDFVQSVERGLAVLTAFDREHARMSLSDVARRTGLSRASARRFLLTLVELGYVRNDGRLFWLTPRVLGLGFAYLSGQRLPEIAQPHLDALAAQVGHSTSISILDGDDIVYIARRAVEKIMSVNIGVGTRLPAWATSMGRVMMADLEGAELAAVLDRIPYTPFTQHTVSNREELLSDLQGVRAVGFSVVRGELEEGLCAVAVPVRDRGGRVVAALNLSLPLGAAIARTAEQHVLPQLQHTAGLIETDLQAVNGF